MKTTFFIVASVITVSYSFAQKMKETEIPVATTAKFHTLYPAIKDVDWEKEKDNYEAEFDQGKTEGSVLIDASGNLLETEFEIQNTELPKSVFDYVAKNYSGLKVREASKITDPNNTVTYEAEMKQGKEKFDLIFDSSGNFIKKELIQPREKKVSKEKK